VQLVNLVKQNTLIRTLTNQLAQLQQDVFIFDNGRIISLYKKAFVGKQEASQTTYHVEKVSLKSVAMANDNG
jgi:hypothetical protein